MEEEQKLFKKALSRAMFYCSKSERCPADVYKKMSDWGIADELWDDVIHSLKEENFISETRYASAFVRDKIRYNKWGRKKVAFQLKHKGISANVINEALFSIEEDVYEEIVRHEMLKKFRGMNEKEPYKLKAKLYNFAISRGYEGNITESIIEDLIIEKE